MAVTTETSGHGRSSPKLPESVVDSAQAWYFYGITRRQPLAAVLAEGAEGSPFGADTDMPATDGAPLQLLEFSGLVAVVRPVLLAEFTPAAVSERLQTAAQTEALVRSHHRVIEAIHALQPILPAKFGMVYTRARDIVGALRTTHETLARQLDHLTNCDEWGVHLFADVAVVRDNTTRADAGIAELRKELLDARPGRLWFLERKLRDDMEVATKLALLTLAQKTFDRLVTCAVQGHVSTATRSAESAGEVEILNASFLVKREGVDQYMEQVRASTDASEGLRCECSGPWPPYSFAESTEAVTI
jgi:hypothetical protein